MLKKVKYLLLILALSITLLSCGCTKDGYVADKVSVNGIDIGSMTREEAISALNTVALDGAEEVTILADGEAITISAGEIGAVYNNEKTADYAIEKSQGIFSGLFKKEYPMAVDADMTLLDQKLKAVERDVVQTTARVVEGGIEVTNGIKGISLDREKVYSLVTEELGKEEKEDIELEFIVTKPDSIDYEKFLEAFGSEYKEAAYIKNDDGTITVTEESPGVVFDKKDAVRLMGEHTLEGEVYLIPCEVVMPPVTAAELEEKLFRDVLGTYSTNFSSSSANRASNVSLAANTISGMVLMPGDVFSFNDALGERTVANGYKMAGAYVAGKTVDQVGGGICQVSSTLYNTVLLSNLEIVERRSHQMTVSYVPIGRDATVNWGTTDFRFKNNTNYPVKLVSEIKGRNVAISAMGTLDDPNRSVKIETNTVSVLEPGEEIVEDPEKEVGFTETDKGSRGYVVDAVRVVYSSGVEVSREKLTRSRYNPTNNVTTIGTKVVEVPTEIPTEVPVTPEEDYQMPPGLIPPDSQFSDTGI